MWLLGGLAALAVLVLLARGFAGADPRALAKGLRWMAIGGLGLGALYLSLTGRAGLAAAVASGLVLPLLRKPWFFGTGASTASPGQLSEVATPFLKMTLDHDSGLIEGEVLQGRFAGRRLADLTLGEALALMGELRSADAEGERLCAAFLDRAHPDWRSAETAETAGRAAEPGGMTREEAYRVLGLEPGADDAAVREAHRRLMRNVHPDAGGSDYLAAKINQAKDLLLGN
ncbi:MAG: molecular chaperone DnaJ [Alphaproteobacteria bacterium]|nr:molecular chaperone DnaJ [Alphaproteobacteria bacterium]